MWKNSTSNNRSAPWQTSWARCAYDRCHEAIVVVGTNGGSPSFFAAAMPHRHRSAFRPQLSSHYYSTIRAPLLPRQAANHSNCAKKNLEHRRSEGGVECRRTRFSPTPSPLDSPPPEPPPRPLCVAGQSRDLTAAAEAGALRHRRGCIRAKCSVSLSPRAFRASRLSLPAGEVASWRASLTPCRRGAGRA